MALEVQLSQKLSQKLLITMKLKQALRILSLSNLELAKEMQNQLDQNPLLEIPAEKRQVEERDPKEEERDETDLVWLDSSSVETHDYWSNFVAAEEKSLVENLLEQIGMLELNQRDKQIFIAIVNNLSENGYLECDLESIAQLLAYPKQQVEKVLSLLKSLDPAGIGARDLKECLQLQLERLGLKSSLAWKIVDQHLDLLAKRQLKQIAKICKHSLQEVTEAASIIQKLRPHPFLQEHSTERYLIPDVKLIQDGEEWKILINEDSLPNLAISEHYLYLINNELYSNKQEKRFLGKRYKEASWFLQAIYQRHDTLRKVAKEIFQFQYDFLTNGKGHLKPLILKDVASKLDIHESTVSRAVNDKFLETPFGIYPLKYFFTSKIKNSNHNVSSASIKTEIKALIDSEDSNKPYSDQKIAEILAENNLKVARRTIAKYREEMKIPSAKYRKDLSRLHS